MAGSVRPVTVRRFGAALAALALLAGCGGTTPKRHESAQQRVNAHWLADGPARNRGLDGEPAPVLKRR